MIPTRQPITHVTRKEYALWEWIDCTEFGDNCRMVARGNERLPNEAIIAYDEWKQWQVIKDKQEDEVCMEI